MKKFLYLVILFALFSTWGSASTVYLAVRTDGVDGTGTQANPYDGSTQAKFDALLKGFGENMTINLAAGTYLTDGSTTWQVKSGWTINGAGMGRTILKLNGHIDPDNRYPVITGSAVNVVVSNLTSDGNYSGWNWPAHTAIGGIFIGGSNITVANVESINCYGDSVNGNEEFSILLCGSPTDRGTNLLIKNCLTHEYPPGADYTNGVMISTCSDSEILDCTDDGSNHAFGSSDSTNTEIIGCSATAKSQEGFYTDTGSTVGLTLQDNTFQVAAIPIQFNSFYAPSHAEEIKIIDNTLASSHCAAAIALTGSGSNVEVIGNTYDFTGTTSSGLILDNGDGFTDLDVENNSTNLGLTGGGGSATSVTSVSTLSGNKFWETAAQLAADEETSGANAPGATDFTDATPSDTPTPAPTSTPPAATTAVTPPSITRSSTSPTVSSPSTEPSHSAATSTASVPAPPTGAPAAVSGAAKTAAGTTPPVSVAASRSVSTVLRLPPGRIRTTLLVNLLEQWVRQDPGAAASYVQSMTDGSEKLNAEVVVAESWEAIDPVPAMNWIVSLPDSPARARHS